MDEEKEMLRLMNWYRSGRGGSGVRKPMKNIMIINDKMMITISKTTTRITDMRYR